MRNAVIVDAVRTPMGRGKATGAFADVHPISLLSTVFASLIDRTGLDPSLVNDVLVGCVSQSGEQSSTPGRQAWLGAGLPESVPSVTIERKCGSGQQAVDFAAQGIISGAYDVAIAAGLESMSRVPMGSARVGKDPYGPEMTRRYPDLVSQGVAAELVADKWGLSRSQLDDYAARSHRRAAVIATAGGFAGEITPVHSDRLTVEADETIRPSTTTEALAQLSPVFGTDAMRERLPHIEWKITAGNSSQITDGASGLLLMSEERARELGLRARARIVASAVCADDPVFMLTAPIPATRQVLTRARLSLDQIDVAEVNEAFASVPLAWQSEFPIPDGKLNPRGGAIALGHPLGASGCRLMTTMLSHLEQTGGRYGLQTMCEAGGMANATIIEIVR